VANQSEDSKSNQRLFRFVFPLYISDQSFHYADALRALRCQRAVANAFWYILAPIYEPILLKEFISGNSYALRGE